MCTISICPTIRKSHLACSKPISRSVLYLNPPKLTVFISHQIERTMLGLWRKDRKSLLEQIQLSLQDTEVALVFGVMCSHQHTVHHDIRRTSTGFHGIAISITC